MHPSMLLTLITGIPAKSVTAVVPRVVFSPKRLEHRRLSPLFETSNQLTLEKFVMFRTGSRMWNNAVPNNTVDTISDRDNRVGGVHSDVSGDVIFYST